MIAEDFSSFSYGAVDFEVHLDFIDPSIIYE